MLTEPDNFLQRLACLAGAAGLIFVFWVLLGSMNPSAAVLAPEFVDLSDVSPGERKTVYWGPVPIFIAHRTADEIARARAIDREYEHKSWHLFGEPDAGRVQREQWLVVLGASSMRGCRLLGQRPGDPRGKYGGWYDPCYRRSYDTSGRLDWEGSWANLRVPPYRFTGDTEIAFPYQR